MGVGRSRERDRGKKEKEREKEIKKEVDDERCRNILEGLKA